MKKIKFFLFFLFFTFILSCEEQGNSKKEIQDLKRTPQEKLIPKAEIKFTSLDKAQACINALENDSLRIKLQAASENKDSLDVELKNIIQCYGLTGKPARHLKAHDIQHPIAQLGKELFFSKSLSGNKDTACASCHHPKLMGGDGLSLPVGVGAIDPDIVGPGRMHSLTQKAVDIKADGSPNVARHSLSTFNSALYKKALFWDGRIFKNSNSEIVTPESLVINQPDPKALETMLQNQALFPLVATEEMRGHRFLTGQGNGSVRHAIIQRLIKENNKNLSWVEKFRQAFSLSHHLKPQEIVTKERLAIALAAYQESQIFVDNHWADYVTGNTNSISTSAKRGAKLFFDTKQRGGMNCAACHFGDHFTDEKFYVSGFPQIGRGKNISQGDVGRFLVTKKQQDTYAFRTPSLLNVALTPPYGHAGSLNSLSDVIMAHSDPFQKNRFNLEKLPQYKGSGYTYQNEKENTGVATAKLYREFFLNKKNKYNFQIPSQSKLNDLKNFLKTLSDKCLLSVKNGNDSCIQPWIHREKTDPKAFLNAKTSTFESTGFEWESAIKKTTIATTPSINTVDAKSIDVSSCKKTHTNNSSGDFSFSNIEKYISGIDINIPIPFSTNKITESVDYSLDSLGDIWNSLEFTGGIISGDFNGDGYFDLLVYAGFNSTPRVLINNREGRFNDQSAIWGIQKNWSNKMLVGAGVADLDGDKDLDLVLTGRNIKDNKPTLSGFMDIYENKSGKWHLIEQVQKVQRPISSVSFTDFNADGKLDITIASWSLIPGIEEKVLWKNEGHLQFSSAGIGAGIVRHLPEKDFSFSPINVDLTGNHYLDMILVSDFKNTIGLYNTGQNNYITHDENHPRNIFTDENGMGATAADFDNDGDMDLFVSSIFQPEGKPKAFEGTGNRLYINNGKGLFTETSEIAGVRDGGWGWGSCAADFNQDGKIDIFHTNGYGLVTEKLAGKTADLFSPYFYDNSKLFIATKEGTFKESAIALGIKDTGQGRGVVCFDYDRDNDIDIIIGVNSGRVKLFKNNLNGLRKSLAIELEDNKSTNTQAIGAKISLKKRSGTSKGFTKLPSLQYREVQANTNYISMNPSTQYFATGDSESKFDLEIIWPRPYLQKTVIENISGDQCLKITRPK